MYICIHTILFQVMKVFAVKTHKTEAMDWFHREKTFYYRAVIYRETPILQHL